MPRETTDAITEGMSAGKSKGFVKRPDADPALQKVTEIIHMSL